MYAYPLLDEWEHPCRREAKAITIRSSNTENCDNLDLAASLFSLLNSQTVCTRSRMSPPPQAGYGNWKFEWPLPKMSAPHLPRVHLKADRCPAFDIVCGIGSSISPQLPPYLDPVQLEDYFRCLRGISAQGQVAWGGEDACGPKPDHYTDHRLWNERPFHRNDEGRYFGDRARGADHRHLPFGAGVRCARWCAHDFAGVLVLSNRHDPHGDR